MSDLAATELHRLQALRMELLETHPFWGHLLVQVRLVPVPGLPSFAATDCVRTIWFNPAWTRHLTMRQLGFVLAHEIGHHVLESFGRARGRNPYLWNCATDYAINRMVAAIAGDRRGVPLYERPDGTYPDIGTIEILVEPRFDGLVAEAIYAHLLDNPPQRLPLAVTIRLPGDDGGEDQEVQAGNHGGGVDVHLPEGLSDEDREELRQRVTAALDAWRHSDRRGDVPRGLERTIDAMRPGRVPWQRLLAQFVGQATAREDYSLARPNRRYLLEDIVVPGLWSETLGQVVVAVDTSGSMTDGLLAQAAGELAALHALIPEVTVVTADAKVHQVVQARDLPTFLAQRKWHGGGGTDHRPVFEWLARQRLQPEVLVGITDLWTKLPEKPPPFPVVWVVPPTHGKAAFGRVIEMEVT